MQEKDSVFFDSGSGRHHRKLKSFQVESKLWTRNGDMGVWELVELYKIIRAGISAWMVLWYWVAYANSPRSLGR